MKKLTLTVLSCCFLLLFCLCLPLAADSGELPSDTIAPLAPTAEVTSETDELPAPQEQPTTETETPEEPVPTDPVPEEPAPPEPEPEPAVETVSFDDVLPNAWYAPYVNELAARGILAGRGNNCFAPNDLVTRAEFAKILAVLSGADLSSHYGASAFPDVTVGSWYYPYVNWAWQNKIVLGSDGLFLPNALITRQEMAVMVVRYARHILGRSFPGANDYRPFPDRDAVAQWALPEVTGLIAAEIISGYEDGTFRPTRNATRAETAKIVSAFDTTIPALTDLGFRWDELDYIVHGGGILDGHATTNSKEALDNAYDSGHRFIEIDFRWTTDDEIVCIHYWASDITERCSYVEFMNLKIHGYMTPMSLETLAVWMREHPDVYIITDIKVRSIVALTKIHDDYPDLLGRFIPQIYTPEEYNTVANMGYENIILTLYQMDWNTVKNTAYIADFARSHRLLGVTMDETIATESYIRALQGSGVLLFAHTVNDPARMRTLRTWGIDGFYTDELF